MRRGPGWLLCAAALAAGCASEPQSEAVGTGSRPGPEEQRNPMAIEADHLLDTDRAFAARVLEAGAPAAFHEFFDPKGVRLTVDGEPPAGPEAVAQSLVSGATLLNWDPRYAEVFSPGDWGMTWGDWQAHEPGAGGRRIGQGRYVSVWKKQRDGNWKVHMNLVPAS